MIRNDAFDAQQPFIFALEMQYQARKYQLHVNELPNQFSYKLYQKQSSMYFSNTIWSFIWL